MAVAERAERRSDAVSAFIVLLECDCDAAAAAAAAAGGRHFVACGLLSERRNGNGVKITMLFVLIDNVGREMHAETSTRSNIHNQTGTHTHRHKGGTHKRTRDLRRANFFSAVGDKLKNFPLLCRSGYTD